MKYQKLILSLLFISFGFGQWPTSPDSPIQVCWAGNNFTAISDHQGGAYVIGGLGTVYCQRLTPLGDTPWPETTLDHTADEAWWTDIALSSDIGLFVSYNDVEFIYGGPDWVRSVLRIQKFDSHGNKLWGPGIIYSPPNGSGNSGLALGSKIIGDSEGGVFVVWQDRRNEEVGLQLYIQHISSIGEKLWGEYGRHVTGSRQVHNLFLNESNDLSMTQTVFRLEGPDTYHIQSFTSEGEPYFEWPGIELPVSTGRFYNLDTLGNYFGRDGLDHLVKVNVLDPTSTDFYDLFMDTPGDTYIKGAWPDQSGGVFVPIYDVSSDSNSIIYHWVDQGGQKLFGNLGMYGCDVEINYRVTCVKSGNDFIAILDGDDQKAFKINSAGSYEWENVLLYDERITHYPGPVTVTDGAGGAIYLFEDNYWVWATKVSAEGVLGGTSSIAPTRELPSKFYTCAYPNPFNPSTMIEYELTEHSHVSLIVYDIAGQVVRTLVTTAQAAGSYTTTWNGLDQYGHQVVGGMYFARLQAGQYSSVLKLVYLK